MPANLTTPNYGWAMPDVGGDATTWGSTLNSDLLAIDSDLYAVAQSETVSGLNVGDIKMTAVSVAPPNWLFCNGQSLSTVGTYAALFAAIGYAYGGSGANFNVPNVQAAFPIAAGAGPAGTVALGASGGAASITLDATMIPAHTHPIAQVAHAHTASQPAHVHPDPGHAHAASQDAHTHNVTVTGQAGYGVGPQAPPSPMENSGSTTYTTTGASAAGVYIGASGTGLQAAGGDAVTVNATTPPGPTATGANAGGGAGHNNLPPYVAFNFLIRYQ